MAKSSKKKQSPLTEQYTEKEESNENVEQGLSRKRARAEAEDAAEERRLTALLFGGEHTHKEQIGSFDDDDEEEIDGIQESGDVLFEIDRSGVDQTHVGAPDEEVADIDEDSEEDEERTEKPAWADEDDADVKVNLLDTNRLRKLRKSRSESGASALGGVELERRLRKRFQDTAMLTARTDWARLDVSEKPAEIEDDPIGSSSAPLLATASNRLPPQVLNVVRCPDANQQEPNNAVVQSVHFHPGSDPDRPLMLTAGLDKTLRFFQVDGEESQKIHGIHFPKLPIYSAQFLGDSGNVVVSGRRPFFYIYDAVAGKLDLVPKIVGREEKSLEKFTVSPDGRTIAFIGNDGYVILVDAKTKHWIADLKMNGSVRAVTFTPDGEYIIASGSDGEVYRWNVHSRQCVERFSNEDGTITSSLSVSMKYLAVGAESGVVNMYSERRSRDAARTPIKSIMNLHTSADFTRFNHDGQILAMSTRREKHGMKLLHVPTATVFSNWPTSKTPLNYVWSMDFSPQSKFLAVGNDKGKCLLYKLMHYQDNES